MTSRPPDLPGQAALSKPKRGFDPVVFPVSAGLIVLAIAACLARLDAAGAFFSSAQEALAARAGWFLILVCDVALVFVVWLMFSRLGRVRLGGREARPEFSRLSWYAMLFSAGMGIGLVFFSVAEPLMHLAAPLDGTAGSAAAADAAMRLTLFHWGLHPWALYALVGVALAYFAYNRGLPMTLRSAFFPLLGRHIWGPGGQLIDILAILATMFGVATSLGLGAKQVNAGLSYVFGIPQGLGAQLSLIGGITALATLSVVLGLKAGIRRLSEVTMVLAALLLAFVFAAGPSLFICDAMVQNLGSYLQQLVRLSTWTEAYRGTDWQHHWTVFYWAWWIAWSPFVGIFIARISYGRTVREMVAGVLLVPSLVTFAWLIVFGNAAIYEQLRGAGAIAETVRENPSIALFELLGTYPGGALSSLLAVAVIVTFFVTSSDSGSLVIDMMAAGGDLDPPVWQRVFWSVLEGGVAGTLLVGGGLLALQTASLLTGVPFAIVLLLLMVSLRKALAEDAGTRRRPA